MRNTHARTADTLGPRELAAMHEENTGTVQERAAVIVRRAELAQCLARARQLAAVRYGARRDGAELGERGPRGDLP